MSLRAACGGSADATASAACSRSSDAVKKFDTPGTSKLTPDQQDYYAERFGGTRYTHVQDQPARPSRKARRLAKRGKRHAE